MTAFEPTDTRYIKLGGKNSWAGISFRQNEIHLGHRDVLHELCLACRKNGDWSPIRAFQIAAGRTPGKAEDFTREIRDFYSLDASCLWITFADGFLWWTFAAPEVTWVGPDTPEHGSRMRRCIGAWSNKDLRGRELRMNELSSRLTAVAAYRQTLCRIREENLPYLYRRIRGEVEPAQAKALKAQKAMKLAASDLIAQLYWSDFEDMVDLIFARSGWQRLSRVGGTQKDIDIELLEPATRSRAFVQLKSKARQATLDDYIERCDAMGGFDQMFFVCHSPDGELSPGKRHNVHIWTRERLADVAIKAGLYDWLMERCA